MKDLKSILKESIFDDDIDVISEVKDEIKKFIEDNYTCNKGFVISDNSNKSGKYEVSANGDTGVKNILITSLTNGLFEWSEIKGDFYCNNCNNLKSLKGSPKIVTDTFYCYNCENLKSLEDAPKKIDESFICSYCNNLETLEGAPEIIKRNFFCEYCINLKSLKGAPKKVGEDFKCSDCKKLKSLEGAPKIVNGDFYCENCYNDFTENEIKTISKVSGEIYC